MDLSFRILRLEKRLQRVEQHLGLLPLEPEPTAPPIPTETARARPAASVPIAAEAVPGAVHAAARVELPAPAAPAPFVPTPEAPPVPPPAPAPTPRVPRPVPAARTPALDLERFLGVAVLGRIGVAALLLAAGYFAQLAYKSFGPELKVASIYALAAAFVGTGFALRGRVAPRYVATLWGGGVAASYLAGVVAKLTYGLVGPVEATGLLLASAALGQWLARLAKLESLAHVALLGAFAAPLLVGGRLDASTALLVYLVSLHAWAAWTEVRFGWKGARVIGVAGTLFVAATWLINHPGMPAATLQWHAHGYLFALTAPEWGRAILGRSVSLERSVWAFVPALVAEVLLCFATGDVWFAAGRGASVLPLMPPLAGSAWLGLAVLARLRVTEPSPAVRGMARIAGGLALATALLVWPRTLPGPWTPETASLAALTVLAAVAVSSRRWLGVGDGVAALAGGAILLLLQGRSHPDPWTVAGFVAPAMLVLFGGGEVAALAGLALGAVVPFAGLEPAVAPWWIVASLGISAAWTALARARVAARGWFAAAAVADVAFLGLLLVWIWQAFTGPYAPVVHALVNPVTVAGLALAGVILASMRTRRAGPAPGAVDTAPILPLAAAVLLFLAGWREVHAAVAGVGARDVGWALETLYLAVVSAGLVVVGRRGGSLRLAGLALLGLAIARAFTDVSKPGGGWSALLELAALSMPVVLAAVTGAREREGERTALAAFALALAALWGGAWDAGRFGVEALLGNPRMASGLLGIGLLVFLRRLEPPGSKGPRPLLLGSAAALLGYVVGLLEVLDVLRPMGSSQWGAAIVSAYSAVYAAGMLAIGFAWRNAALRWLALGGFGVVIVKVGLHDLAFLETPFRILVTGCLGVVLLVAAYAYARRDRGPGPGTA